MLSGILILAILVNILFEYSGEWYLTALICISLMTNDVDHLFPFTGHVFISFCVLSVQIFCPFLVLLFLHYLFVGILFIFFCQTMQRYESFARQCIAKYFLPSSSLFHFHNAII